MAESALMLSVDSFWISPYAFSCYVALKEKGLPFEVRAVSLPDKDHHRPEYQQKSLTGRVPMLQHGDFTLSESSAIVEYLDDAFPGTPRALPSSVRDRARARQIMAWVRSDLMPIREERATTTMFYERATKPLSPAAQDAARRLTAFAQGVVPEGRTSLRRTVERGGHRSRVHPAAAQPERVRVAAGRAPFCRDAVAAAVGAGVGEARSPAVPAVLRVR